MNTNLKYFLPVFLMGSCVLTSCSKQNEALNIFSSFKYAAYGKSSVDISREKINSIPYASISGKIGKGTRSMLILGLIDQQNLGWYSADRNVFITKKGRLIMTEGLPKNLSTTMFLDEDPIANHTYNQNLLKTSKRSIDFKHSDNYGVIIDSEYELLGQGTINIADVNHDTYVIKETGFAKQLNWKFENLFWKDIKTGFVWKSIQYFEPETPPITIEVLKPPAL